MKVVPHPDIDWHSLISSDSEAAALYHGSRKHSLSAHNDNNIIMIIMMTTSKYPKKETAVQHDGSGFCFTPSLVDV